MPRLTPTRTEISDRFPVLGFRVHSGKNPYYEVAIATDAGLFHADSQSRRTARNFYSTRSYGLLAAEHGETLYLVPADVLRRFAGADRLYYTIATFHDSSGANPEVLDIPDAAKPWVTLSKSFTGKELRRQIGSPHRRSYMNGDNYGNSATQDFTWAGDSVTPGTVQTVQPKNGKPTAVSAPVKTGSDGQSATAAPAAPATPAPAPASGNPKASPAAATAIAEEEFEYDDGHGEWPSSDSGQSASDEESYGIEGPIPDNNSDSASDSSSVETSQEYSGAFAISPDYPQASRFVPADPRNFSAHTDARNIDEIVIHIADSGTSIGGPISQFATPPDPDWKTNKKAKRPASAHYIVGQDGEVVQMVRNQDVAYHAQGANLRSIGIEHVARAPHAWDKKLGHADRGLFPTQAEYCASAALVNWLCTQYNIPIDRQHILGHREADPHTSHDGCPDKAWNWDYFMKLVASGTCMPMETASAQTLSVRDKKKAAKTASAMSFPKSKFLEQIDPGYAPTDTASALAYMKQFQDRKQAWKAGVPDTTFFPHSAICRFRIMQSDGEYIGTGFYISQDRILTCGHNVANATSVTIIPAKNDAAEPFGSFTIQPSDWVVHPKFDAATSDSSDTGHDFDLAVIKVSKAPPNGQAFVNLEELLQCQDSPIIVCGYAAATVDADKQHLDGDTIRLLSDSGETLQYNLQTEGGNSGSPVYYVVGVDDEEQQVCRMETRVVGVHVSSFSKTLNQGCRLTADKIAWIRSAGQPVSAGAQAYSNGKKKLGAASALDKSSYTTPSTPKAVPPSNGGQGGAKGATGSGAAPAPAKSSKTKTATTTAPRSGTAGFAMVDAPLAPAPAPGATSDLPLSLKDADYSEEVGDDPDPERGGVVPGTRTLNNAEMYRIAREVARADSGDNPYTAISSDREFSTPGHGAYQKRHFGLGFGLLLFTQESGHLGSVLRLMQQRDPEKFSEIFGPDSDSLMSVTNADTPEARLAPINGQPLWSGDWSSRFQAAGAYSPFQAAQNEETIEGFFRPILNAAAGLGLITDRLLAMALDVAVRRGPGGAIRWLVAAAGPFETEQQRQHALASLEVDELRDFQAEVGWTPQDGQFGPETHAALAGAIRRLGQIPLPKSADLPCRLLAAARGPAKQRLAALRDSDAFTDVVYRLA